MSLVVWLPLNGDLTQQGLSNVQVTNNGATVNNEGKIGKCYQFGTASSGINIPSSVVQNFTECSVAFWVKIISWNTSYATLFQIGVNGRSWQNYHFGILRNSNSSNLCFVISNGTTSSTTSCLSSTLQLNQWYHLAFTYNKDGYYRIYIDGVLDKESYTETLIPNFASATKITLGRSNDEQYQSNCLMNDIRIYDHCLSTKEIKEISKGLVLHYKLNKNRQILNNCYNLPTFNTNDSGGGWSHWGRSGSSGSNGQNTDKKYIYRSENPYSHWVANAASATGEYLVYQSPAFDGGYRSLQCIVKEENSSPITENVCFPAWNARNGGTENEIWTSIDSLGEGFYLCKCEGISQDGSNDLVGIYVKPGYKVYFSECYLENNTEKCSDFLFVNNNIEEDCSGYSHDGNVIGTLVSSNNSPKYSNSTYFYSSDPATNSSTGLSYIETNFGLTAPIQMSVCWWAKPESGYSSNTNHAAWCTSSTSEPTDYNSTAFHHRDSTFDICLNSASTTSIRLNMNYIKNEWHYYCVTYDGKIAKLYRDGIFSNQVTVSSTDAPLKTFSKLFIGYSKAGGVWRKTLGFYSDFRIYSTALSAEDVLELYHTSASIDNKGNVYAYELEEV